MIVRAETKEFLTAPQIARMQDVSYQTVIDWMIRGVRGVYLGHKKVGGRYRIRPEDLVQFEDACNGEGPNSLPRRLGTMISATQFARQEKQHAQAKRDLKLMGMM